MLDKLTHEDFQTYLNTKFQVSGGSNPPVELDLHKITGGKEKYGLYQFSLLFTGPIDQYLPQQIYTFQHKSMDAMELFIVPVGKDEKGYIYEAVFNRSSGTAEEENRV